MNNLLHTISGIKIFESKQLTEPKTVKKTLKERFLKYPFKFWIKEKTIQIPSRKAIVTPEAVFVHPLYMNDFISAIERNGF